ncbi:MAG: hypothetical protein NDF55_10680 [archaeon GB-1867-005]|nr:hypothetical protein [Candidatus Culexmicrobium cathedralense]
MPSGEKKPKMKLVHLSIREDLYEKLWQIVKKRFVVPLRKFHIVVNEALEEYIEKNKHLLEDN